MTIEEQYIADHQDDFNAFAAGKEAETASQLQSLDDQIANHQAALNDLQAQRETLVHAETAPVDGAQG